MSRLSSPTRRAWLRGWLSGTALSLVMAGSAGSAGRGKPDIVVIVFDDLGFSDFGCFGSEIETPAIDALAKSGLRYTAFDTKAICSPSRAALLTGRNSHTVNMADLAAGEGPGAEGRSATAPGVMRRDAQMLPDALRRAGYATFAMGKWHLAPIWEDGRPGNNEHWPLQVGFDRFYGFKMGWDDQYRPKLIRQNETIGQPEVPGYHFSQAIVDESIAAIASTPKNKPYFLYLALGATHAPLQVPKPYVDRYRGRFDAGWDALREARFARMKAMGLLPGSCVLPSANAGDRRWADLGDDERKVYARYMETYAGFLTHADEQVGRLVEHLRRTRRLDNTLILVVSDNGGSGEAGQPGSFGQLYPPKAGDAAALAADLDVLQTQHIGYQRPWAMLSDTPYRRYKSWPHLGGVRTPMIVSWPAGVRDAGAVRRQAVDIIDLAPTLAEAAGARFATTLEGKAQLPVAGRSIAATFRSASAPDPRPVQYFELRGNRAIRVGRWRAVSVHRLGTPFEDDRWALYDLAADPAEARDLAGRFPKRLEALKAAWWVEAKRYGALPLGEGPEYVRKLDRYRDAFLPDQDS